MGPSVLVAAAVLVSGTATQINESYGLLASQVVKGIVHACSDGMRETVREEVGRQLATTGRSVSQECPAGWSRHGDTCYLIPPRLASWPVAHHVCATLDSRARLASVHPDSRRFVESLVESFGASRGVWIGLARSQSIHEWVWSDGTPLDLARWEPGQPNNGDRERCAHHGWPGSSRTGWHDNHCTTELNLLCQLRIAQ
ncbi:C-type lectin-like [Amphibalanus amphitrite]|uniref:C-type lectin-like n=1 Tax=Amphibalanus amphitrite TaxID=1232801 RepID=UPI001C90704A|nr:C-type lectin-like [Amphibalanus amphitrite]